MGTSNLNTFSNVPFPIEVVAEVVKLNLQVTYDHDLDMTDVSCDGIPCSECPIDRYTATHNECEEAITYIRNKQIPLLLQSNPELFV